MSADAPQNLLAAEKICVRFGSDEILHDITLAVAPGEIVTILGPNGSGKSTLLRALLGIAPLTHGQIRRAPGLRIGYVPQKLMIERTMPLTLRRFLSLPGRVSDAVAGAAPATAGRPSHAPSGCSAARSTTGATSTPTASPSSPSCAAASPTSSPC